LSKFDIQVLYLVLKMSEVATPVAAATPVAEKKVKKASTAAKKPKTKPNHPPTSEMVDAAIGALKERGGSSLLAIKKYIAATYKVDVEKLAPFLKKYIKGAVVKGHFLQTKGKGASGSFKLSTKAKPVKKTTAAKPKKAATKPKTAKPAAEKKKTAAKPKTAAKKPVAAKKVVKAKATAAKKAGTVKAKPAAAKPKAAPKPKKAAVPKKAAAPKAKKPAAKKAPAKK
jgi:histone H1/5